MSAASGWPWPDIRWHEPHANLIPWPPVTTPTCACQLDQIVSFMQGKGANVLFTFGRVPRTGAGMPGAGLGLSLSHATRSPSACEIGARTIGGAVKISKSHCFLEFALFHVERRDIGGKHAFAAV